MKHNFEISRHWELDFKDYVNIEIIPVVALTYEKHNSLNLYCLCVGWLCFSIEFKYVYYKKLR